MSEILNILLDILVLGFGFYVVLRLLKFLDELKK